MSCGKLINSIYHPQSTQLSLKSRTFLAFIRGQNSDWMWYRNPLSEYFENPFERCLNDLFWTSNRRSISHLAMTETFSNHGIIQASIPYSPKSIGNPNTSRNKRSLKALSTRSIEVFSVYFLKSINPSSQQCHVLKRVSRSTSLSHATSRTLEISIRQPILIRREVNFAMCSQLASQRKYS